MASVFTRRVFSQQAHVYTHGHASAVVANHAKRTAEDFAPHLVKVLRPGDSILDVGCGPGSITAGFRKYVGNDARIVGIDVEPKVLEEAKKIVGDKAIIEKGDVYALQYADASFDVVHAHQVLQHLKDPITALVEMTRVAKSIVTCREVDYESWVWFPADPRLQHWKDSYRAVCRRNQAEPDAGRRLKSWFMKAGFEEEMLQIMPTAVSYTTRDRVDFIADSWSKRVRETQLGNQMVSYGLATREQVEGMADAWIEWGKHKDAVFFYVDVAVIARKKDKAPIYSTAGQDQM